MLLVDTDSDDVPVLHQPLADYHERLGVAARPDGDEENLPLLGSHGCRGRRERGHELCGRARSEDAATFLTTDAYSYCTQYLKPQTQY